MLIVCSDADRVAKRCADMVQDRIADKQDLVLGLAAGRTMGSCYQELVRRHHELAAFSMRNVTTFNTDEFVGLRPNDSRSARYFMNTNLYLLTDLALENTHVPRGDAVDPDQECRGYECFIRARGGLDLVVLGLGHNGHIAFNEPGSSPRSRTRVVEFTESTIAALSDGYRFPGIAETPSAALSMGIATIMEAREILLVATGIGKTDAVHRMFDHRPGPSLPASQLLEHDNFTVLVDRDAASALRNEDVPVVEEG